MGLKKLAKKTAKSVKKAVKKPLDIPKKVISEGGRVIEDVVEGAGDVVEDGVDIIEDVVEGAGDVIGVVVDGAGVVLDGTVHVITEIGEEFEEFVCDLVGKEPGNGCNVSVGAEVGSETDVVLTDGSGNESTIPEESSDFLKNVEGIWSWSREQEQQKFARSPGWVFQNPLADIFVTSPFGPRNDGFHGAVDLRARTPNEVFAAGPGMVIHAGPVSAYPKAGITVTVRHPQSIEVQYMHLSSTNVRVGDLVFGGSPIAITGDTGSAAGKPHLHMVVKVGGVRVDPMQIFGKTIKPGTTVVENPQ